jgi:nicotinamide-nucleotide amidase
MSDPTRHVDALAELALEHGFRIGAAESLTGGALSSALARGSEAMEWYRGCVVSYSPAVKEQLLGVTSACLVTEECARQMVRGALRALDADAAVSTTGAGGPGPEEGQPAGTVFVGVSVRGSERCHRLQLGGDPGEVVEAATERALGLLLEAMRAAVSASQERSA